MRVLYVLAHFPQNSESYVEAEMKYFTKMGVSIEVWSPLSGYGDRPGFFVHRSAMEDAIRAFRPNVVHIHHMTTAAYYVDRLFTSFRSKSVTIRAHSFDWDDTLARRLVAHSVVRRVFAFPHLAERVPGVAPLPVAYDPMIHYPETKDRRSVVRLAACLPTKRLVDFLEVGNRFGDEMRFTLAVNLVLGKETMVDELSARNKALGGRVRILSNLSRADASELTRKAGIYLGTHDPSSHPFGMPISIAEALASGSLVLEREAPGVSEFMGKARLMYSSTDLVEKLIRASMGFSDEQWKVIEEGSRVVAERFRSDVVLPRLFEEWHSICLDNF